MSMRRSSPVLVGREAELRALIDAVDDRQRRPLLLVGGEAGIGKSRLIAELATRCADVGIAAANGSCVRLGGDALPYAPFVDGLARVVDLLGGQAGSAFPDAPDLVGELLTEVLEPEVASPAVGRARLFAGVCDLLDRAPTPLLFVMEDIHWADRSSLDLLAHLTTRLRHGRTAIVATFRTDELHRRHPLVPVLAELTRSERAVRFDLERLDAAAVGVLVRTLRPEASDRYVAAVAERSEGNPFLAEELVAVDAGPNAPLPATLRDLLLARLAGLDEPERRVVGIVACVGRPAEPALLAAAWEGSVEDMDRAVRSTIEAGLVVVRADDRRLAFRHALIGEAVVDELLPGERVRMHGALAEILTTRPDLGRPSAAGAAAEIAHHRYEAHDLPGALRASVTAGDTAVAAHAFPEAREAYERALELLDWVPGIEAEIDRPRLLDASAEVCFHLGDPRRAVTLGRIAVDAAGGEDPVRSAYLMARLLSWAAGTGEISELAPLGEQAAALVSDAPPSAERAHVLLSLASAWTHAGRHRAALRLASQASAIAVELDLPGPEASARAIAAISLVGLGRDRDAVAEIDRAVQLADATGGPVETAIAHIDRAAVYSAAGRPTDLPAVLAEARAALDRAGITEMGEAWLLTDDLDLLVHDGCWDEAAAMATRTIEAGASPSIVAWHRFVRGQLRIRRGQLSDGEADLEVVLEMRPPVEPDVRARACAAFAEASLIRDDPAGAIEAVDRGAAILADTDEVPVRAHLWALGCRAAADLAALGGARRDDGVIGTARTASDRYHASLQGLVDVDGVPTGARLDALIAWGLAEHERIGGAPVPTTWTAAAASLSAVGEPHLASQCRLREAESILAARGGHDRAAASLRLADTWATTVGAAPLQREIRAVARRARLDLDAPAVDRAPGTEPRGNGRRTPAEVTSLSRREFDVLALLVDGRTNREIGSVLFITEKTASSHVTHILDKLGVTSRGAAAAAAVRYGLVDWPRDDPPR